MPRTLSAVSMVTGPHSISSKCWWRKSRVNLALCSMAISTGSTQRRNGLGGSRSTGVRASCPARQCGNRTGAHQRYWRRLRLRLSRFDRPWHGGAFEPDFGLSAPMRRCASGDARTAGVSADDARRECGWPAHRHRTWSLAGWRFSRNTLELPAARCWLEDVRSASRIDVFASSHTGLPVLRDFSLDSVRLTVINNGAAGMPNFGGANYGVLTCISVEPSPHPEVVSPV